MAERNAVFFEFVSMPVGESAVEISGLVKRFGSLTAVDQLDLRVPAGGLLALLGPNGAGKTTTVEICAGFIRPHAGTVRVLGMDPRRHSAALRPRLGIMPQGGGAYPGIKAAEMLDLMAACAAHPLNSSWLLDVLGLTTVKKVPFKRLSQGQQQRLSLACAVINRPELVFLDEPTAGMDPQARRLVWDLLRALRADGVSVLLTTHLMDEAEALADTVVIMSNGKAIAQGTPRELTGQNGAPAQLTFSATDAVDMTRLAIHLGAEFSVEECQPHNYRITGAIDPKLVSTLTSWCAEQGILAEDIQIGRRDLEDVYLELTGQEVRA